MPDDVVGDVRVDVHGNTVPLENDIQQGAHRAGVEAGKSIDAGIAKGMDDTAITDNIVGQIDDAEKPAGESGVRTGRAITKGVGKGVEQNKGDVDAQIKSIFAGIDESLQKSTKASETSPGRSVQTIIVRLSASSCIRCLSSRRVGSGAQCKSSSTSNMGEDDDA